MSSVARGIYRRINDGHDALHETRHSQPSLRRYRSNFHILRGLSSFASHRLAAERGTEQGNAERGPVASGISDGPLSLQLCNRCRGCVSLGVDSELFQCSDSSSSDLGNRPPVSASLARGRPFAPGRSGNPRGRPKGARNKATILAEQLLEGEAEELVRTVIDKAKAGDSAALRLCVERLLSPRRDRLVTFELPKIETAADACAASAAILDACAKGALSPREATEFMSLLSTHGQLLEATEPEKRIAALEAQRRASP
jgi:hypothetical protein